MSARKRRASTDATDPRRAQRARGPAKEDSREKDATSDPRPHPQTDTASAPPCVTPTALLALLDFTLLTSHAEIAARFDVIAEALLHRFLLRVAHPHDAGTVGYTDYEILELEFYLYMPGLHEDPFTHGSDEQRQSGRWYFHRVPRRITNDTPAEPRVPTAAGGYRGGTRKGLDLTLGGPAASGRTSKFFSTASSALSEPPRGGALLRTLRRICDDKVISGPSLLVDEIIAANKTRTIAELVTSKWDDETDALSRVSSPNNKTDTATMYFYPLSSALDRDSDKSSQPLPAIYRSSRIGLDLSHASIPLPSASISDTLVHPRTVFVSKPYRYFVHPHLLTSNGRGHTFHGVYQSLADQSPSRSETALLSRVVKITGLKPDTVTKYLQAYRDARSSGSLTAFVGAKGKGAGSAPAPLLRMLGTLERLREAQSGHE